MKNAWTCILFLACLGCALPAQGPVFDAIIPAHAGSVFFFDSASGKITTAIPQATSQSARGACFGPTGLIYASAWTTNGIDVLDPTTGAWINSMQVTDPTNAIMGAPYQPCPNYDNVGGFGLMCVDGNAPPSPPAPASHRNTFIVDYAGTKPTFRADGYFPNTKVPMSDFYPNLLANGPGEEFVGVGFYTSDQTVSLYPLAQNPPSVITPKVVATLPYPSRYDATWCEDGNLYIVSDDTQNGMVMQIADIRTQKVTTVAIQGLPSTAAYAAVWAAPWEQPGMKGWICSDQDDNIYSVDLFARPMVVTKVVALGQAVSVNTGRHAEECQLCSWRESQPGARTFVANFGGSHGGKLCVLAPSISGILKFPFQVGGLELHLKLDTATLLGLQGLLPYPNAVFLATNGQASFLWRGFGVQLGIRSYWQAVVIDTTGIVEASNIINVEI